jgi:hypothetical protein
MVHHIQTKRLTHLQEHKNPHPKHKQPKHLHNKKIAKQKILSGISNHQKWFEVTQDGIISHEKYPTPHWPMNWFEIN